MFIPGMKVTVSASTGWQIPAIIMAINTEGDLKLVSVFDMGEEGRESFYDMEGDVLDDPSLDDHQERHDKLRAARLAFCAKYDRNDTVYERRGSVKVCTFTELSPKEWQDRQRRARMQY